MSDTKILNMSLSGKKFNNITKHMKFYYDLFGMSCGSFVINTLHSNGDELRFNTKEYLMQYLNTPYIYEVTIPDNAQVTIKDNNYTANILNFNIVYWANDYNFCMDMLRHSNANIYNDHIHNGSNIFRFINPEIQTREMIEEIKCSYILCNLFPLIRKDLQTFEMCKEFLRRYPNLEHYVSWDILSKYNLGSTNNEETCNDKSEKTSDIKFHKMIWQKKDNFSTECIEQPIKTTPIINYIFYSESPTRESQNILGPCRKVQYKQSGYSSEYKEDYINGKTYFSVKFDRHTNFAPKHINIPNLPNFLVSSTKYSQQKQYKKDKQSFKYVTKNMQKNNKKIIHKFTQNYKSGKSLNKNL